MIENMLGATLLQVLCVAGFMLVFLLALLVSLWPGR